jgi:DNA polymerase III delta prime subunit
MQISQIQNSLWVEKYRPQKVQDVILPEKIKSAFTNLLLKKEIPNLLLTGSAGTGKTTIAKAFANEVGANVLFINASKERGIDVLRTQVENFVSTCSLDSTVPKVVIFDEIDNMSQTAILALRGFIENFSSNARFFLTCNYASKIADPIRSRMQTIEFDWSQEEKKALIKEFGKRLLYILEQEKVKIEEGGKKALSDFVKRLFPDMRKILGSIQLFSQIDGTINEGILYILDERKFEELYRNMKEKNFSKCREWVANNISNQTDLFYEQLFKDLDIVFVQKAIPEAITILHEHLFKNAFVFDKQLNVMSCLVYLMAQTEFK